MYLTCKGKLKVKCNNCGKIIDIDCDDLPFEITETEQREQGAEHTHSAKYQVDCDCGSNISIEYDIWEYPEGSINDTSVKINGGTLIQECDYYFEE